MSPPHRLLDTTKALEAAAADLRGGSPFAIDTEFESGPGGTRLCLIQIAAAGGEATLLVDTTRLTALESLAAEIAADGAEWVLHAGRIDVELLLDRLALVEPPALFDTQVAWGLLGAEYSVSLAYLNYRVLDLRSGKEHQADPWDERPLSESQLAYAASDVETLPRLRARLLERLEEDNKTELVYEVSREVCFVRANGSSRNASITIDDFRRAWELDAGGLAALRSLIDWFNETPREDRPATLKPRALFAIARRMPESGEELARIKGVHRRWAFKEGDALTARLIRATREASETGAPPLEPRPYATFDELRVDGFLSAARYAVSRAVSIAPELCFPTWLVQDRLRPALLDDGDLGGGEAVLEGWRAAWLAEPYTAFRTEWRRLEPA